MSEITAIMGYWADRCSSCGHARGHHGEGGCTALPGMFSRTGRALKCGCRRSQGSIQNGSYEEGGKT